MPTPVVRGILISLGIIAALGYAVYENPEVQEWLEEQRRKLAQLLRSMGDELDPQSRQEAEAFAFGSHNTASSEQAERDSATQDAVALATGRSPTRTSTIRRMPTQSSINPVEREERQRLGREYLARRNQQMLEMQERRRVDSRISASSSFDSLVDTDGKLKIEEPELENAMKAELFDAGPSREQEPLTNPFDAGASHKQEPLSNPFNDETLIDRSTTPRPIVPPKIKLEHVDPMPVQELVPSSSENTDAMHEREFSMPGSMPSEELSYEDQLALALAISKESAATTTARGEQYDDDLRTATEASLRDAMRQQIMSQVEDEDLYTATPHLTRASLATLDAQHPSLITSPITHLPEVGSSFHSAREQSESRPFDGLLAAGAKTPTEASSFAFQSDIDDNEPHAPSAAGSASRSHTMSEAELIEVEDQDSDIISEDGIATPDSWTEVGSHDGDSDVEMHVPA